ncbi:MAG: translation initiation factor IF-2 [Bacteroidota bacterium]
MAKRLIKVAKSLNVGTSTIVEFLNQNGFEIEDKPIAKVTDEMEKKLREEFQESFAIKEKADQLIIGTRPIAKKETPPPPPPVAPPPPPPIKKAAVPPPPPPPVVEEKKEEAPKVKEVVNTPAEEEKKAPRLKILGKIDLDARNKKKKPKQAITSKQEVIKAEKPAEKKEDASPKVEDKPATPPPTKEVKEQPTDSKQPPVVKPTTKPKPTTEEKPTTAPKEENAPSPSEPVKKGVIRAEAPKLKGTKILGKIDIGKFSKSRRKKGSSQQSSDSSSRSGKDNKGPKPVASSDSTTPKKRRRKRKKIETGGSQGGGQRQPRAGGNQGGGRSRRTGQGGGNRRRGRNDEVKEVSAKEIEEKIKATMARLQGGGGKKRQKLRREKRENIREKQEQKELENVNEKLQLTEFISVSEFAGLMDVPVTDVIMTCMNLGVIVSINQRLDAEIIELVAEEFDHEVEFISAEEQVDEEEEIVDDPEDLQPRAPIVTVMGHVDHGKTSLLDYIRKANVADGEAGGITQHIGAYEVLVGEEKKKITFLDTPGHEAFTAMRARGAKVTDIAVIIIAADDSIMPQTKEAISHAQAAGVPIIFAINKIDKDGASPDRIKQQLSGMNLLIEEWGGPIQSQDISAKTGLNIDLLLEKILLEAELLELQANPDRQGIGAILEASLDKGRGYVSKALVQTGTLKIGDPVVAGEHSGKIKAMFNERGERIKTAGPATPVLVLGLSGAPQAGEKFRVMDSEQETRQIAAKRAQISREQSNRASKRISLDEIGRRLALGTFKELNLIVKGDVDGSIEALSDSLIKQSIETVQVNVIHKAVGQIIESDVLLASASDAIIIGFQVRPSLGARKLAEKEGVEIKTYSIIYEAIEEIRSAIEGMLEPTKEEKVMGEVQVRETYKISKIGTVAGCYVQDGKVTRNAHVRLIRNGIVVYPTKEGVHGEISSLKRFKDDAKEVKAGLECGITIKNFNDIKVDDIIEVYEIVEVKQTLEANR